MQEAYGFENCFFLIIVDEKHTLGITMPVNIYLRIWLLRNSGLVTCFIPSNERRDFTVLFLYFTIKMTNRML